LIALMTATDYFPNVMQQLQPVTAIGPAPSDAAVAVNRPQSVTAFGVMNIVFGGVATIALGVAIFFLARAANGWMLMGTALDTVVAVGMIGAGVGLLQMQPWARMTSIAYAIYASVVGPVTLLMNLFFVLKPGGEMTGLAIFLHILLVTAIVGYGATMFYFMTRPVVVDAFENAGEHNRHERGWLFWAVAVFVHVRFVALLALATVLVITPPVAMTHKNFDGVEVAAPQAPPQPQQHQAQLNEPVPEKPNVDFNQLQPVLVAPTPNITIPLANPQAAFIPNALPGQMVQANVPDAWKNRMIANKKAFVPDPAIEDAVMKALRWLKANQNADGSWGGNYPVGMTGLALLTFLAHGETPQSREFGTTVRRGLEFLLPIAERGRMGNRVDYEHGIATYALAEAYGMTKDERLKEPLERCLITIINGQTTGQGIVGGGGVLGGLLGQLGGGGVVNGPGGGWIYGFNTADPYGDMSISGWQVQAMKAAYLAGLLPDKIPPAMERAMVYAKAVYNPNVRGFGYRNAGNAVAYLPSTNGDRIFSLTGTGVLCLQFWNQGNSAEAQGAIAQLRNLAFQPAPSKYVLYGYYYATQALFLADGPRGPNWETWDKKFRRPLIMSQNADGSYPPCQISQQAMDNAVYSTTLSTLMLEVWYRNDASGLNITVLKQGQQEKKP
jgi:hypothetical protein